MENPWIDLPQKAPYILDCDKKEIMRFNKSSSIETKFQLNYIPEPFQGDPKAPIVLLSLNPGFNEERDSIHLTNEHFRKISRNNLLHTATDYPFYLLNPEFKESGGHKYWIRKLRDLIEEFSLKCIARQIFVVEYYGYHSKKCGFGGELPSQKYNFNLVREAIDRNAVIVVLRHYKDWMKSVPELKKYKKKYVLNSPRAGTVSKKNCPQGYNAIKEMLVACAEPQCQLCHYHITTENNELLCVNKISICFGKIVDLKHKCDLFSDYREPDQKAKKVMEDTSDTNDIFIALTMLKESRRICE